MKEAKQQFDDLVARIKDGKTVSFGEAERVYAGAFLGKFLERVVTEASKDKMQQFYRDHLVDSDQAEEYMDRHGEEMELSGSQLSDYALEQISVMSGVLGIRATTKQLSPFIEKALRNQDWELLEKTLALSEEGIMGTGVIDKVALEQLVDGRDDSYQEIKKRFGTISFDEDQVRGAYKRLLYKSDVLKKVRSETGIPIPQELVQEKYETLPAEAPKINWSGGTTFEVLAKLQSATEVAPNVNKKVKDGVVSYFSKANIQSEDLTHCQALFGLYGDEKLAPAVQQALLARGELDLFSELYANSVTKLSESKVKAGCRELSSKDDLGGVYQIAMATGIAPSKQVLKRVYSDLLERNLLRGLDQLSEKVGVNPTYDQETVNRKLDEKSRGMGRSTDMEYFRNLVSMVQRGNCRIPEEYIHRAAKQQLGYSPGLESLSGNFRNDIEAVDGLYQDLGMKPSTEVTAAKVSGLAKELSRRINKLEGGYCK